MKSLNNLILLQNKPLKQTLKYIVAVLCLITVVAEAGAQNFLWAKSCGKAATDDRSTSIVTDASGSVYTLGYFSGTIDFNPGAGTFNLSSLGNDDVFLQKLAPNGNFVWALSFGGKGYDWGKSIKIDELGNIYILGDYNDSIDLDPGPGVNKVYMAGGRDAFLIKLNSNGSYIWGKTFGGGDPESAAALALDAKGNPHTIGYYYWSADMDPGPGVYNITASSNGYSDVFIQKLDSSGKFVWAKSFGGGDDDEGVGISVDARGNVYTTGHFVSVVDFDPGVGTFSMTATNIADAFVHKLDSKGNFIWAKAFRTSYYSIPKDLVIDKSGGIYSTGWFKGNADFDPGSGSYSLGSIGDLDIYISKLDSNGNIVWAKSFGGIDEEIPGKMAIDKYGSIYTTGYFMGSVDFNTGPGSFVIAASAYRDVFIHKLDNNGNFLWVKTLKGSAMKNNEGIAVTVEKQGDVYSTGSFESTVDFDPGPSTFNLTSTGAHDIYVHKIEKCSPTFMYPAPIQVCNSYKSPSGKVYTVTGTYQDTLVTAQKCDSIINLNIKIRKSSKITIPVFACNQYTSPSKKYTWASTGVYQDTLPNKAGCDSLITIMLYMRKSGSSVLNISTCNTFVSPSKKYTWIISGAYRDTIKNIAGCDSFMLINLVIRKSSSFTNTVSACKGIYGPGNKRFYSKAGTYNDTLLNVSGCDSFITTTLTLLENTGQINVKACNSFKSPSSRYTWKSSGLYTDTIPNIHGCDSIIKVNLQIQNSSSTLNIITCNEYTSPSKKHNWGNSGLYSDTLVNKNGCDSVISINLTIDKIDTSITQVKHIFTANMPNAEYQWINCSDNFTHIPGANTQVFEASKPGSYAVMISMDICSGISPCRLYAKVDIENPGGMNGFNLYPVPASHTLFLKFSQTLTDADISIYNSSGQLVKFVQEIGGGQMQIDIANLPPGFYTVKIESAHQVFIGKMIKE